MVSVPNEISIDSDVEAQRRSDWRAEEAAIKAYNEDIPSAGEAGDNGTRDLLASILGD